MYAVEFTPERGYISNHDGLLVEAYEAGRKLAERMADGSDIELARAAYTDPEILDAFEAGLESADDECLDDGSDDERRYGRD